MDTRERLLAGVSQVSPSGCWIWQGATANGYGIMSVGGRSCYVHRVAYRLFNGPIPDGLTIDHVKAWGCTSKLCANPTHLEAVDVAVNVLRGDGAGALNSRKTACLNNHLLSGDNLRISPKGYRLCRMCERNRTREAYRKRIAAKSATLVVIGD